MMNALDRGVGAPHLHQSIISHLDMRYLLILILFIFGCGATQLQVPPETEPTAIEQRIAEPLNACQRGKYYAMIRYRHEMIFYLNSDDEDVSLQAARNLQAINMMIDEMIILGIHRQDKKKCFE